MSKGRKSRHHTNDAVAEKMGGVVQDKSWKDVEFIIFTTSPIAGSISSQIAHCSDESPQSPKIENKTTPPILTHYETLSLLCDVATWISVGGLSITSVVICRAIAVAIDESACLLRQVWIKRALPVVVTTICAKRYQYVNLEATGWKDWCCRYLQWWWWSFCYCDRVFAVNAWIEF